MKFKILFCLLIPSFFSFAQSQQRVFHETCYRIYQQKNEFEKAIYHYKEIAKYKEVHGKYYSPLIDLYIMAGRETEALKTIEIAVSKGLGPDQFAYRAEDFKNPANAEKVKKLSDDYLTVHYPKFFNNGGKPFKEVFANSLFEKDQAIRNYMDFSNFDSLSSVYCAKVDSINLDTLVKFIKKYGFIKESEITSDCYFGFLLMHLVRYNNSYLDSCVRENCRNGNTYAELYAIAKDQIAIDNKESIYGTVVTTFPVKDVSVVDSLRQEIGYPTLYEESLYKSITLPQGYKPDETLVKLYAPILDGLKKK